MKRFLYFISMMIGVSMVLSACNLNVTPPAGTESPASTTEAGESTVTPGTALVPIDLAGPPMQVGSQYPYVDGTLIMAVPGGAFMMGYGTADNPAHNVTISSFWIYSTKVTNQQYALCVQSGKCTPPDEGNNPLFEDGGTINFPVTGVNYEQASQYCSFVHGRLPTEAEWEKSARGPESNIFPWGDAAPTCDLLNSLSCVGKTTPITSYKAGTSFYGALDMAGNTREWTSDWYNPTYYSESPATDPLGPELGEKRSVRGSSYQDLGDVIISAHRFSLRPGENLPDLGFRCVVEDPTYFAPMCQQLAYIGIGPDGKGTACTPDVKCNDVSVSQSSLCTKRQQPYTIVSFNLANTPPASWNYDVPGCSQIGGTDKFQCSVPGQFTASVTGSCEGTNSCVSACPAGYTKVGDVCKWDGASSIGKECIPGMTYDPLTQCCSASPTTAVDFNVCPAGYYQLNGACIANPSYVEDKDSLSVQFNSCVVPKGNGDQECTLVCDPSYPACQTLDLNTCTCVGKLYSCG